MELLLWGIFLLAAIRLAAYVLATIAVAHDSFRAATPDPGHRARDTPKRRSHRQQSTTAESLDAWLHAPVTIDSTSSTSTAVDESSWKLGNPRTGTFHRMGVSVGMPGGSIVMTTACGIVCSTAPSPGIMQVEVRSMQPARGHVRCRRCESARDQVRAA